jgi:multicomponent Na+:H+ antiporter subunit F
LGVGIILLITSFFGCLFRAIAGPTLPDRIIGVNIISTKALIILVLIAYIFEQSIYLDVAFVYALLNFIVTVTAGRYLETGRIPEMSDDH